MRRLKRIVDLAGILLSLTLPAYGHDQWADGTPVPEWVKKSCCGPNDVHMDPPIYIDDNGCYHVEGLTDCKPYSEILPSQDGHVWVFYNDKEYQSFAPIYCFFIPTTAMLDKPR